MYFPTHARAPSGRAAASGAVCCRTSRNPLRAVETYQEYLGLPATTKRSAHRFSRSAQQLAGKQRYLEALHVFSAFVDSFPTDPRAAAGPAADRTDAPGERGLERRDAGLSADLAEYPTAADRAAGKLAMAECHINLSQWRSGPHAVRRIRATISRATRRPRWPAFADRSSQKPRPIPDAVGRRRTCSETRTTPSSRSA